MTHPSDDMEVAARIASLTQRATREPAQEEEVEEAHDEVIGVLGLDRRRRQELEEKVRAESAAARQEHEAARRLETQHAPASQKAAPAQAPPDLSDAWARELTASPTPVPLEDRRAVLEFWGTFWTQERHALLLRIEREDPHLRAAAQALLADWQPPEDR